MPYQDLDQLAANILKSIDPTCTAAPDYGGVHCSCDYCQDVRAGYQKNLELVKSLIQSPSQSSITPEELAQLFHETGVSLASKYGYEPVPTWSDLTDKNQAFVTEVAYEVLKRLSIRLAVSRDTLRDLKSFIAWLESEA